MSIDTSFLTEKAKNGDSAAFSELYGMFSSDLYRFALYMLASPEDAEDAVQEAVLSAWKSLKSLKDSSLFKAWVFKILSNKCKNILALRKKNPDALPDEDYDFLVSDTEGEYPFKSMELIEALKTLTPPDGQIVLLSVIGGFTSSEIARIYSLPPGTVRSKQQRALQKLRVTLS